MCNSGSVVAGVELLGERVERQRVVAKVADVEDSFCVGQIEARKIRIESRIWRPKVWDAGGCTDACASLI